eukprot:CAMPEP_0176431374 /NCGR_PEP_ID=MMETSP0127-20121128/14781_1 /TAXON_ID=938130 /ORGANISM="Platyophrya macrostoma, Strain WH" /LENGTH=253 /DNA_ID=CAMNT_0017813383 /DNA_START=58 /DNA_END=819 /DNA_ORIENTATION=-
MSATSSLTSEVTPSWYVHQPYGARVLLSDSPRSMSPGPQSSCGDSVALPGTLHTALIGRVNFVPYPLAGEEIPKLPLPSASKANLTRLFLGQLPYGTTAEQLQWVVHEVSRRAVYFTETIHTWTGEKQCKGCAHTYCAADDASTIIEKLHRRALIDDTGIWVAETEDECDALENYCESMRVDKSKRHHLRPCQPVVAQMAVSSFVPKVNEIRSTTSDRTRNSKVPSPAYTHTAPPSYFNAVGIPVPSYRRVFL